LAELGGKPLGREYPETSIGWYRTFDLPASDAGKRIAVEFDGVFRDAQVMLNGHYIGGNVSGYARVWLSSWTLTSSCTDSLP
jgi:beta-galactosidase